MAAMRILYKPPAWDVRRTKPRNLVVGCHTCAGEIGRVRCSACKCVWYCSKTCQTLDWKQHKSQCDEMKRKREQFDEKHSFAAASASSSGDADTVQIINPQLATKAPTDVILPLPAASPTSISFALAIGSLHNTMCRSRDGSSCGCTQSNSEHEGATIRCGQLCVFHYIPDSSGATTSTHPTIVDAELQKRYPKRWIGYTSDTAIMCGNRSCQVVGREIYAIQWMSKLQDMAQGTHAYDPRIVRLVQHVGTVVAVESNGRVAILLDQDVAVSTIESPAVPAIPYVATHLPTQHCDLYMESCWGHAQSSVLTQCTSEEEFKRLRLPSSYLTCPRQLPADYDPATYVAPPERVSSVCACTSQVMRQQARAEAAAFGHGGSGFARGFLAASSVKIAGRK